MTNQKKLKLITYSSYFIVFFQLFLSIFFFATGQTKEGFLSLLWGSIIAFNLWSTTYFDRKFHDQQRKLNVQFDALLTLARRLGYQPDKDYSHADGEVH